METLIIITLFELIPQGYKSRRNNQSTDRPKLRLATVKRNIFCKAFALKELKLPQFCQFHVIVTYIFHYRPMDIFMNEIFFWHNQSTEIIFNPI